MEEVSIGRQEPGMLELGPAVYTGEQEENAETVEAGTGNIAGV